MTDRRTWIYLAAGGLLLLALPLLFNRPPAHAAPGGTPAVNLVRLHNAAVTADTSIITSLTPGTRYPAVGYRIGVVSEGSAVLSITINDGTTTTTATLNGGTALTAGAAYTFTWPALSTDSDDDPLLYNFQLSADGTVDLYVDEVRDGSL